jgi:dTDP-4-dehydrorhamnose reductase
MVVHVKAISTADFGAKAHRPAYSVLDSSKLEAALEHRLRPWGVALAEYLEKKRA